MDHLRDFDSFKRLIMRLCVTFDKFASEDLIESWWKALRDVPYKRVETSIEAFIARADDKTKFPRPGQFRSDGSEERTTHSARESEKNWAEFIARFPTTGPIRKQLSQCSATMASTYEGHPAHAEAFREYLHLEKQLGARGRFSADC